MGANFPSPSKKEPHIKITVTLIEKRDCYPVIYPRIIGSVAYAYDPAIWQEST